MLVEEGLERAGGSDGGVLDGCVLAGRIGRARVHGVVVVDNLPHGYKPVDVAVVQHAARFGQLGFVGRTSGGHETYNKGSNDDQLRSDRVPLQTANAWTRLWGNSKSEMREPELSGDLGRAKISYYPTLAAGQWHIPRGACG